MITPQELLTSYRGWPGHCSSTFGPHEVESLSDADWREGLEVWSPSLGGSYQGWFTRASNPYSTSRFPAEDTWHKTTENDGDLKDYLLPSPDETSKRGHRSPEPELLVSPFTEAQFCSPDCGITEGASTSASPETIPTPDLSYPNAEGLPHIRESVDLQCDAQPQPFLGGEISPKATPLLVANTSIASALGPSKVWTLPPRIRRKSKIKPSSESSVTKAKSVDKARPKRRGAFTDDAKKRTTALTRQLKSCIRCRMNRGRCLPDPSLPSGPCLTCQLMTGPTLSKMPCYRYIITDASLYREQKAPYQLFSRRWQSMDIVDIPSSDWAPSSSIRTIVVTHLHVSTPFQFQVREFIPAEGDLIEDEFIDPVNGTVRKVPLPRFAIADMRSTAERMKDFVDGNIYNFITATVGRDELLWETYLMAFRQVGLAKTKQEQTVLSNTFRLWAVCRMTSSPVHICGDDTLGGTPHPLYDNKIPMPLIMTAQFECINYTTFLRPWSKAVLKQLNDLVLAKKREYWFTIYLVMFVLLHSCAMITRRDEETARQYDMPNKYANPASIKEHHCGAQTMLAHFHYINRGVLPFSLPLHTKEGRKDLAKAADLTEEQVDFVRATAEMVRDRNRQNAIRAVRENEEVGHDLYWISMLFDEEWKPKQNE
ncbi:hypothetical protein QBC40DRAFT_162526 [Triangularia verruculosa]|uniref:Zn(2)-C6 fungal-type domain-containing protein n=1 Tax=Triangularia verruculosa TaxID=2587418 RepID=A0AAN6XRG9_9PEZI|nr:hypothetical protein QBC40DRAFT_162526 [Triangularia verruculosa]